MTSVLQVIRIYCKLQWLQLELNIFCSVLGQVINHPKQTCEEEAWSLVSETFLSRGIDNGTQFVLKKSDISLLCVVKQMPYFNISEKVLESQDRFVLRLNSETSV